MKKERRFNAGDTLTYRSRRDCPDRRYYFDGSEQGGKKGKIVRYTTYNCCLECWEIFVSTESDGNYTMLESEFLEYDNPKQLDNYSIW